MRRLGSIRNSCRSPDSVERLIIIICFIFHHPRDLSSYHCIDVYRIDRSFSHYLPFSFSPLFLWMSLTLVVVVVGICKEENLTKRSAATFMNSPTARNLPIFHTCTTHCARVRPPNYIEERSMFHHLHTQHTQKKHI